MSSTLPHDPPTSIPVPTDQRFRCIFTGCTFCCADAGELLNHLHHDEWLPLATAYRESEAQIHTEPLRQMVRYRIVNAETGEPVRDGYDERGARAYVRSWNRMIDSSEPSMFVRPVTWQEVPAEGGAA